MTATLRLHALGVPMAAALLVAGCATPGAEAPPVVPLPAAYPAGAAGAETPAPAARQAADWWTQWRDPQLDALVARVLQHNAELRLATLRVHETAALVGLARAAQWPAVDLQAGVARGRVSQLNGQAVAQPESTTHRIGLATAFEIDLWGRLRNASAAAQAQLQASEQARDAVRSALAAATVQAWFGLRALDRQQALLRQQLGLREQSLKLVDARVAGGLGSALEQAQARAALAALQAQAPELARQRAALARQIGVLAGDPGWNAPPADAALPAPLTPPPGLPSQLLQRRPDLRAAESRLVAARAQAAAVRAAAFPTLSLTAGFGAQSADLGDLLRAGARTWSLAPALLLPLFDGGRQAARGAQAQAQAELAALAYVQAVQEAFREVADALAAQQAAAAQREPLAQQRAAAAEALRVAQRRLDNGFGGYLELLDAQRTLLDAEAAALRREQAALDADVALFRALGGGWVAPR